MHMYKIYYIVLINLFAGRNRDADLQNILVDTAGEGEGGMH